VPRPPPAASPARPRATFGQPYRRDARDHQHPDVTTRSRPPELSTSSHCRSSFPRHESQLAGGWCAVGDAREAAREAFGDDRVLRLTIVTDTPPRFVDWINR
jgi:hypothetical protein